MISARLKRLDIIVIASAVLLSVIILLPKKFGSDTEKFLSVISERGEQTYSLRGEEPVTVELTSRGIAVKITIVNGSAYIESSDCPNGICMKSPEVKNQGDSIVCAPAGLAIIVKEAGGGSDADAFAG